jgi:hypothetical protein
VPRAGLSDDPLTFENVNTVRDLERATGEPSSSRAPPRAASDSGRRASSTIRIPEHGPELFWSAHRLRSRQMPEEAAHAFQQEAALYRRLQLGHLEYHCLIDASLCLTEVEKTDPELERRCSTLREGRFPRGRERVTEPTCPRRGTVDKCLNGDVSLSEFDSSSVPLSHQAPDHRPGVVNGSLPPIHEELHGGARAGHAGGYGQSDAVSVSGVPDYESQGRKPSAMVSLHENDVHWKERKKSNRVPISDGHGPVGGEEDEVGPTRPKPGSVFAR